MATSSTRLVGVLLIAITAGGGAGGWYGQRVIAPSGAGKTGQALRVVFKPVMSRPVVLAPLPVNREIFRTPVVKARRKSQPAERVEMIDLPPPQLAPLEIFEPPAEAYLFRVEVNGSGRALSVELLYGSGKAELDQAMKLLLATRDYRVDPPIPEGSTRFLEISLPKDVVQIERDNF